MAYVLPTTDEFIEKFPEFEDLDVSDDTLQATLDEAARSVDTTWLEGDYKTAILYLAAHLLSSSLEMANFAGGDVIRSVSLGRISVTYADPVTGSVTLSTSTPYGERFLALQRLNNPPFLVI